MDSEYPYANEFTQFKANLLDRLAAGVPEVAWDNIITPAYASYEDWYARGTRHSTDSPSRDLTPVSSKQSSPTTSNLRPSIAGRGISSDSLARGEDGKKSQKSVVARISKHTLKLEREYQLDRTSLATADPEGAHHVRVIGQLLRLPPRRSGETTLVVILLEDPGTNAIRELLPQPYAADGRPRLQRACAKTNKSQEQQCSLTHFLEFAIGAAECCELLHQSLQVTHGELRGDSFHYSSETGAVKLLNYGSTTKSFEHGLTSEGWSKLSQEFGVEYKLQSLAPEQSGRVVASPDSRTDIYALGILFFSMLTGTFPFCGDTPLEVVQNVLGRRVPSVATKRLDVPDALSACISKMIQRNIEDRYHAVSGLKWDLLQIQKFLNDGDSESLRTFEIASKDMDCFFKLPDIQVGRENERQTISRIIERAARRQLKAQATSLKRLPSISSSSSMTDSRRDSNVPEEDTNAWNDTSPHSRISGFNDSLPIADLSIQEKPEPPELERIRQDSDDVLSMTNSTINRPYSLGRGSFDTPLSDLLPRSSPVALQGAPKILRNSQKYNRTGKCEVISISAGNGLGKSGLLQSIQPLARAKGYAATSKFSQSAKTPFHPLLKVMSSLFRQIFSEHDVSTDFHNTLRTFVAPVWNGLHTMLDLPESLLSQSTSTFSQSAPSWYTNLISDADRRSSSPASARSSAQNGPAPPQGRTAADFLRAGSSAKSSRFSAIYMEVLRFLALQKFVMICIDDVQYAEEESLDLLSSIVDSKIPIVLALTFKDTESLPLKAKSLLSADSPNLTKIELRPLDEQQLSEYVEATLRRDKNYVFPLVAVILEKTRGNPFFVREMLELCYRKECLWYSFKELAWRFDLDKIFSEFEAPGYGTQLDGHHILTRLESLSPNIRKFLAWASILGNSFSFSLIKQLMHSESHPKHEESASTAQPHADLVRQSSQDAVKGLQGAISAYIIIQGDGDDTFVFCHDRYLSAARHLPECRKPVEMHFAVAKEVVDDEEHETSSLFMKSSHICSSSDMIKSKVQHRAPYREILRRAAETTIESGGRSAGLNYYSHALTLLQKNPWDDSKPDVSYQETLNLFMRTAECYFFQGHIEPTMALLQTIFRKAKSNLDKVPAWILQSRVSARRGDNFGAFNVLKDCLSELGIELPTLTWADCDKQFLALREELSDSDANELLCGDIAEENPELMAIGCILCEMMSAAFWVDPLRFYQLAIVEVDAQLHLGVTSQIGLAFVHFATVAVARFGFVEFGYQIGKHAKRFFEIFRHDNYTIGRGETLYCMLLGYLGDHGSELLPIMESAMEASLTAGDRFSALLSIGLYAANKIWCSQDVSEVERYCMYGAEELRNWQDDVRAGVLLFSIRQFCRALQGKTDVSTPETVMDDEELQTKPYLEFIGQRSSSPERSKNAYLHYVLAAQFLFGHYAAAIETGETSQLTISQYWSLRFVLSDGFYLSLSYMGVIRESPEHPKRQAYIDWTKQQRDRLVKWSSVNNVNLLAWSHLLTASLLELDGCYGECLRVYEEVLDHTELHNFIFEHALAAELYAEFMIRRGASRPARKMLNDAMAAYRSISMFGKAQHLASKHEWSLKGTSSLNSADAGSQTIVTGSAPVFNDAPAAADNAEDVSPKESPIHRRNRTESVSSVPLQTDPPQLQALGLDMIDVTSILQSSQVIASELQIDKLLSKMTQIILESTGAELCATVIADETAGWSVAAICDAHGRDYPSGESLETVEDVVGKQVTLYCLRFKELVFLENVLQDERFSNAPESYRLRNPGGKSVIAMPILQGDSIVLGCIYIEGPPHSFSQRNVTVLRLLVNSISVSLTNAKLFEKVEKVSASNKAMVESQKHALKKAKHAEAEALRNARLKEEAAKAKTSFLANTSHELRTPLNGVIGMSELLKASNLTTEQEGYADSIRVCADTLLTVINDILDYSKLEAGKMQMFSVPLNLTETVAEVVRALSYSNMERNLQTIMELELSDDLLVMGDPVRLHQIFMNLLSNSYKFTSKGSVTVRAVVDTEDANSMTITFSVADTGCGISEEEQQRLFRPFSQADSSTARKFGGTGLGLSICKAIIENVMKGKIWLSSKPNDGTTVSFTLSFARVTSAGVAGSKDGTSKPKTHDPMAVFSTNDSETSSSHTPPTNNPLAYLPRDQLRVCIAEDNPVNQKIAISFVKKLGFQCEAYGDGQQAVDAISKASTAGNPFHIVLMDVQMPVLDGYDATRDIRKSKDRTVRDVIIIAMTASAIRGDREKCLEAGMDNYLAKPVRQQMLKQMLDGYINRGTTPPDPVAGQDIPPRRSNTNGHKKAGSSRPKLEGRASSKELTPKAVASDTNGDTSSTEELTLKLSAAATDGEG